MFVENVTVDYRDRPKGSESKLNTYSSGAGVAIGFVGNHALWDFHPSPGTCPSYKSAADLHRAGTDPQEVR